MTSHDWILFLKLTLKSALILTAVGMTVWQSQENKGKLPMENVAKEELKDWGRPRGGSNSIILKPDGETAIVALREALAKKHGGNASEEG